MSRSRHVRTATKVKLNFPLRISRNSVSKGKIPFCKKKFRKKKNQNIKYKSIFPRFWKNLQKSKNHSPVNAKKSIDTKSRKQLIAYKGDNIKLSSIDKKYCVGFIEFLNNTKKSNGEPLSSYTKIMYCNHLNEMLSRAVKGGMIYKNPFSEVDKREKPKISWNFFTALSAPCFLRITAMSSPFSQRCS